MDGVLVVDKPAGPTSHDVVARARRSLRTSRIGHTGTLDPFATGVLPLVIGRATRLASFLSGAEKAYTAGVRLGLATDTYDGTTAVGPRPAPPAGIDAAVIEAALARFRGTFSQVPPPFSAKKVGGVPAYKLARRNEPVALRAVDVSVSSLSLIEYADGLATIQVTSSAGFYVRSLAHELGVALGCGAHLETLRRTRAGAFSEAESTPLQVIEVEGSAAAARLIPLDRLLPHLPSVVLNERGARKATHGNEVGPADMAASGTDYPTEAGARWRLLDAAGSLVGIAESRPGGLLHPTIVLV